MGAYVFVAAVMPFNYTGSVEFNGEKPQDMMLVRIVAGSDPVCLDEEERPSNCTELVIRLLDERRAAEIAIIAALFGVSSVLDAVEKTVQDHDHDDDD